MRQNRFFEPASDTALRDVYEQYLSKPYSDLLAPRGVYIDEKGVFRQYQRHELIKKTDVAYRPNHGLSHNVRVTAKVRDLVALYANFSTQAKRHFKYFNTSGNIEKLQIAGAFYVACRNSEAGWKAEPDSPYQLYRKASSEAFYEYAKNLKGSDQKTSVFTEEELKLYKDVLRDPYFDKTNDHLALTGKDENAARKAVMKAVLSSCHALDLARCFHAEKMNHKIDEVLAPLGTGNIEAYRGKVIELFVKSEIQHLLTGTKCASTLNRLHEGFHEEQEKGKMFLFRLAETDPDVTIRLVALSEKMIDVKKAHALSVSLNYHAIKGIEQFKAFLTDVESCFSESPKQTLDAILENEKRVFENTSDGRIFKTIRADSADFWDDFVNALVDPKEEKKELRNGGPRKKFTVKLKDGKYQAVTTNKEEKRKLEGEAFDKKDKETYTRHQSTSYSNYQAGYNPPYFGHSAARSALLVGMSFHPDDCKYKRIMMYDTGTVSRPYDFDTKELAEAFIKERLEKKAYHTSLHSLQETGLLNKSVGHNEVMAKLRWSNRAAITVFSDNLESRLLAQLRAKDLEKRLKVKYPGEPISVAINIYPEFSDYSEGAQKEDQMDAEKNHPELKAYWVAMQLIADENTINDISVEKLSTMTLKLIQRTNKSLSEKIREKITTALKEYNVVFPENRTIDDGCFFLSYLGDEKKGILQQEKYTIEDFDKLLEWTRSVGKNTEQLIRLFIPIFSKVIAEKPPMLFYVFENKLPSAQLKQDLLAALPESWLVENIAKSYKINNPHFDELIPYFKEQNVFEKLISPKFNELVNESPGRVKQLYASLLLHQQGAIYKKFKVPPEDKQFEIFFKIFAPYIAKQLEIDDQIHIIGDSPRYLSILSEQYAETKKIDLLKKFDNTWWKNNVNSFETFNNSASVLNHDILKMLFDTKEHDVLQWFSNPLFSWNSLPKDPNLLNTLITHPKTKGLLEKMSSASAITDQESNFFDVFYSSEACLNIMLSSDFYKTSNGVRALEAARQYFDKKIRFENTELNFLLYGMSLRKPDADDQRRKLRFEQNLEDLKRAQEQITEAHKFIKNQLTAFCETIRELPDGVPEVARLKQAVTALFGRTDIEAEVQLIELEKQSKPILAIMKNPGLSKLCETIRALPDGVPEVAILKQAVTALFRRTDIVAEDQFIELERQSKPILAIMKNPELSKLCETICALPDGVPEVATLKQAVTALFRRTDIEVEAEFTILEQQSKPILTIMTNPNLFALYTTIRALPDDDVVKRMVFELSTADKTFDEKINTLGLLLKTVNSNDNLSSQLVSRQDFIGNIKRITLDLVKNAVEDVSFKPSSDALKTAKQILDTEKNRGPHLYNFFRGTGSLRTAQPDLDKLESRISGDSLTSHLKK